MVKAVDIQFDINDISHQFAGFGAQVWPGDMRVETLFADLHMRCLRMCPGGCSNPPTDATPLQMDAYIDSEYNGTIRGNSIVASLQMAERLDVRVILNMFGGPTAWLDADHRLKSESFDDFARLWASQVYFFKSRGLSIHFIEMANEPEGDWNIYIPDTDYNTVVTLLRQELDGRGLTDVGIIGPGLAYLYHGSTWINAMDSDGRAALAGWSTHAWDEGWGHTDAWPSFLDQRWRDYFGVAVDIADPTHSKPIIVTEYATGVRTYNGVTYGNDFTETNPFAQRCYENSLTLINNGANVLCYWEAANQSWQTSPPLFGLLRADSTLRPVYDAFSTLLPFIPDNAMVLRKTWNDDDISAAGFVGENQLVLAFANSTANTVNRTVGVTGITSFTIAEAQAFESGAVVDKLSQVSFDYDASSMDVTLLPESTLTIAAIVNECTVKRMGDISGDCRATLRDFSIIGVNWLRDDRSFIGESVDDFEVYSSSLDLRSNWSDTTANVTISIDTTTVRSGNQSMKYAFNNGAGPGWSKAGYFLPGVVWNTSGVDWNDYSTLSVWYNVESNGGDDLKIKVVNCWGGALYTEDFGRVPPGLGWQEATINLAANLTPKQLQHVGRVDIMMLAGNHASGTIYFDDIMVHDNSSRCIGFTPGDVTSDCIVDLDDLLILSENWLKCTLVE